MCAGQTKMQLRTLNSQPNKWKEIVVFINKNFIESVEAPVIRKFQQQGYDTVLRPCKAKIVFLRVLEHFHCSSWQMIFLHKNGIVIKKRAIADVWVFQITDLASLSWLEK